mmetsp:Transcript_12468/g.18083  ORF Transcript_12468/g.18083 Transcript_12468/m.18083 type:complete len:124 (+) Transcript_12468:1431-1802(+)
MPASSSAFAILRPSYRGLESITITRKSVPIFLALRIMVFQWLQRIHPQGQKSVPEGGMDASVILRHILLQQVENDFRIPVDNDIFSLTNELATNIRDFFHREKQSLLPEQIDRFEDELPCLRQ